MHLDKQIIQNSTNRLVFAVYGIMCYPDSMRIGPNSLLFRSYDQLLEHRMPHDEPVRSVKHILAPALVLAKITRYDRSPKDFDASLKQLANIFPCLHVLSVIVGLVRVLGSGRRL